MGHKRSGLNYILQRPEADHALIPGSGTCQVTQLLNQELDEPQVNLTHFV